MKAAVIRDGGFWHMGLMRKVTCFALTGLTGK